MQRPAPLSIDAQKAAVIDALAEHGMTLADACRRGNMPSPTKVAQWRIADPDFDAAIRMVLEARAHAMAEDMLTIADRAGEVTEHREVQDERGNIRFISSTRLDSDKLAQDRLKIDVRKWLAAKWFSRIYGERATHEHTGEGGGAVRLLIGPTAAAYKPKPKDIEQ